MPRVDSAISKPVIEFIMERLERTGCMPETDDRGASDLLRNAVGYLFMEGYSPRLYDFESPLWMNWPRAATIGIVALVADELLDQLPDGTIAPERVKVLAAVSVKFNRRIETYMAPEVVNRLRELARGHTF